MHPLQIAVGSKNPAKVKAVEEVIADYAFLQPAEVRGIEVSSEVSVQPHSLEETIHGAKNRARNAYAALPDCNYSFGLESGLLPVPYAKTGFMDLCVCMIYDGTEYRIGLSCAFEFPPQVMRLIHEQGVDAQQAAYQSGLTTNSLIGAAEGVIGLLTKSRMTRKEQTKQAIVTALITFENAELYRTES